jgi:hypothetical protein
MIHEAQRHTDEEREDPRDSKGRAANTKVA